MSSPSMSGSPRSSRTRSGRRLSQRTQRLASVGGLDRPVPADRQLAPQGRARLLVVLDDEDRRTARPAGRVAVTRTRPAPARWPPRSGGRCRSPGRRGRCGGRRPGRPWPRRGPSRRRARSRCRIGSRRTCPARGRTCRTAAAASRPGRPGPPSSMVSLTRASPGTGRAITRIWASSGAYLIAFSSALVTASSRNTGSTVTGGAARSTISGRSARRARSRSIVRPTRSSSSYTSRSARSAPASIRLRSRRLVTRRLRYSTSRSIASALSRWSSSLSPLPGRSVPAAARIVASGVRRSCDTDCSSADLSASLWRAISAAWASAASRSCASAWPTWSAAADRRRVAVRSGSPRLAITEAPDRSEGPPRRLDPDAIGLAPARAGLRASHLVWWTRLQRAGVSSGVRWRT